MKRMATPSNQTGSSSSSRRYKYTKTLGNRKHAIRGLWRRNGKFVAQETTKLRWAVVDFEHKLLTIGADADTKNREARRVDFNAQLEAHLKAMQAQRAPESQWRCPSPQRGERDEHPKTFREYCATSRLCSMRRAMAGWYQMNRCSFRAPGTSGMLLLP